jgi:ribosomal protein S18 acetylase RimI-like enzyme
VNEAAGEVFYVDRMEIVPAEPRDHVAVRELFWAGVVEGQVGGGDTGADIENLEEGYYADHGASGFWVARYEGEVIGMIGVQKTSDDTAEVRRLRVKHPYRRRHVGTKLMEHAIHFCQEKGYLKVILDVRIDRGPAIALFEKFGFNLYRDRNVDPLRGEGQRD